MTMRRPFLTPAMLSLFVAVTATAVWWGDTPASAATVTTGVLVPIKGTVIGLPESVSFSGQAQLNVNVVDDPDFHSQPSVLLSIDLSQVTGVGSSTGKKYVTSSQTLLNRRLNVADSIQLSFPFFPSGGSAASARVGLASFNLSYDVGTMKLTGATAEIASQ